MHLIIQTPGGELYTSYKIAYYLRKSFKKIQVYVPYQAASGGTLFCCAADEICLGDLGNLTPIDPQLKFKSMWISAYAFERSASTLQQLFGEKTPQEVPTPWQQMADKIDPVIFDEMQTLVFNTYLYAKELLIKSNYSEDLAKKIARRLSQPDISHAHPILSDMAKEIGLKVGVNDDKMEVYSNYVSARLKEKSPCHIIEEFIPIYEPSHGNENQSEPETLKPTEPLQTPKGKG